MEAVIQSKDGPEMVSLNPRKAIRGRCLNCSAWKPSEVRTCEFTDCALWPFRMGKGGPDKESRQQAMREYCLWCTDDQPLEIYRCQVFDCPLWYYRKSQNSGSQQMRPVSFGDCVAAAV